MNFKTSFAIAALALACFSSSADARGNGNNWLFYVGGDYQYTKPSWEAPFDKVLANSLDNGIDIHVGARWNGYFAAELGYTQSTGDRDIYGPPPAAGVKGPLVAKTDVTISGPTLDGFAYLPLGNSGVAAFGTAGLSYLSGRAKIDVIASGATTAHKTELGYRGGVGVEWRPAPYFGVRFMGRYQSADFNGVAKSALVGSVGFNFYL